MAHSRATWRKANLRTGYTTGACAAAAAGAATQALLTKQRVTSVAIDLPAQRGVRFSVSTSETTPDGGALCGVIKDAGDDPDVTHGLEIQALVTWRPGPGVELTGGRGVGVVTRPGLVLAPGEPAINPAPRRMIRAAVMNEAEKVRGERGLLVTIMVPGGLEVTKKTLNPKLGILGGISILGTNGIVTPFSTSAYRAGISTELKMAVRNGARHVVLTTGKRSQHYAELRYPHLPEYAFVQVGDHVDYGLKQSRRLACERVTLSGMIGKISKLACGQMQTHVSKGEVSLEDLAQIAARLGANAHLQDEIRGANTAHHVQNILARAELFGLEAILAQEAAQQAAQFIQRALPIQVLLWDLSGNLLGEGAA